MNRIDCMYSQQNNTEQLLKNITMIIFFENDIEKILYTRVFE